MYLQWNYKTSSAGWIKVVMNIVNTEMVIGKHDFRILLPPGQLRK